MSRRLEGCSGRSAVRNGRGKTQLLLDNAGLIDLRLVTRDPCSAGKRTLVLLAFAMNFRDESFEAFVLR
jgi:hypothetical protein